VLRPSVDTIEPLSILYIVSIVQESMYFDKMTLYMFDNYRIMYTQHHEVHRPSVMLISILVPANHVSSDDNNVFFPVT